MCECLWAEVVVITGRVPELATLGPHMVLSPLSDIGRSPLNHQASLVPERGGA